MDSHFQEISHLKETFRGSFVRVTFKNPEDHLGYCVLAELASKQLAQIAPYLRSQSAMICGFLTDCKKTRAGCRRHMTPYNELDNPAEEAKKVTLSELKRELENLRERLAKVSEFL